MQRCLDLDMDVNKPFENVSYQGRIQNFFREGAPIFDTFLRVLFFSRVNFKQHIKTTVGGSVGMLPRKFFENLHTVMAILVLFEQFLGNVCHILAPNFKCFTNDAFCSHSFDYACLRRLRHVVLKRFEIIEKFYSSKTLLLKMADGGNAYATYSTFPPGCVITKDGLKFKRDVLN